MNAKSFKSLKVDQWPQVDRLAWALAQLPLDPLEPSIGYASRWAPSSRNLVEGGYGHWLSWLASTGQLVEEERPADRATRARVPDYLKDLKAAGLADYTCAGRIKCLADALRAIAPDEDWRWITLASSRLHADATPSRDFRSRLRPADEVLQLGIDMMDAAQNDRFRGPIERATLYRDGLMVALMVSRPLRINNFASLELGNGVDKRGDSWWITIQSEAEKTGREMEFEWPAILVARLERYLAIYRPALQNCSTKNDASGFQALWISQHGTAMTKAAITYQIESKTEQEFGEAINPHAFRKIAATTIATIDPGNATDIASVLGHSGLKTAEKHYNLARMVHAGRLYTDVISEHRGRAKKAKADVTSDQPMLI